MKIIIKETSGTVSERFSGYLVVSSFGYGSDVWVWWKPMKSFSFSTKLLILAVVILSGYRNTSGYVMLWNLVLISVSLISNDLEHHFLYLLRHNSYHIYFLLKCLLKYFAYFLIGRQVAEAVLLIVATAF